MLRRGVLHNPHNRRTIGTRAAAKAAASGRARPEGPMDESAVGVEPVQTK